MERLSSCFVQGCFTYDLAVQFVGTLGALGVALLVYWLSQRDQDSAAKMEHKTQQARFESQTAQLQQQIDHNLAESRRQQERWLSEQRTHALERELEQSSQHLKTASVVRMEFQRLFEKNRVNDLKHLDTTFLDGLTGAYSVLPGGVPVIRAAHEMAQVMATPDGPSPKSRDLFGSHLDSAITTLTSLESALVDSVEMLNLSLREEAGVRVELIEERQEFERFVGEHREAPEE